MVCDVLFTHGSQMIVVPHVSFKERQQQKKIQRKPTRLIMMLDISPLTDSY